MFENLRRRKSNADGLRKALLDAAQQIFVPLDLQIRMQAALHQHARAAEFDCLLDLFVDRVEIENVPFLAAGPFSGR